MLPIIKEGKRVRLKKQELVSEDDGIKLESDNKLQSQEMANRKLCSEFDKIKQQINREEQQYKKEYEDSHSIKRCSKEEKKLQDKIRTLNLLILENNKLKELVNDQRNNRVIYLNIYKNLEHQIHLHEEHYKNLLIQKNITQAALTKLSKKFEKFKNKIVCSIKELKQTNLHSDKDLDDNDSDKRKILNKKTQRKLIRLFSHKSITDQGENSRNILTQEKDQVLQLQFKKIFYDSLYEKIASFTQTTTLSQARQQVNNTRIENGKKFEDLQFEQKKNFDISKKIANLSEKTYLEKDETNGMKYENYEEEKAKSSTQILEIQSKIEQLSDSLFEIIGFNVSKLTNQQILRQCLRKKQCNRFQSKKLQKLFHQIQNKKDFNSHLMTFSELKLAVITNNSLFSFNDCLT